MALLPVAEAQSRLFALAQPLPVERVALTEAAGRWAAEDIVALRTQPSADLSSMDGYAVRSADLPGPWRLIGESAAGRAFSGETGKGEAVRIFTGAAMPMGADMVLLQEDALCDGARVTLTGAISGQTGGNVRPMGLDFITDDLLIEAGELFTPARLALAAMAGHATLAVRRKPRIAIAATGDELAPPHARPGSGQIPETNRLMLAAQLSGLAIEIVDLGILPDRSDALESAFRAVSADLLVTSGGASVGDHDLVRPALRAAGGKIDFWRIALRPGKPMMAGRLNGAIVLGLPGNPVSAFVTTALFVRPLIAHLSGASNPLPPTHTARLAEAIPANDGRADYLRAILHGGRVSAASIQDSSMLRTLSRATCLIVRAPDAPAAKAGDPVDILDIA